MSSDLRMWHVGNWCIHQGAKYIESPFEYPSKDVEIARGSCTTCPLKISESTAGYPVRCAAPNHPAARGIDWTTIPPLLGFNETRLARGASAVIEIEDSGAWFPLLADREIEKGRVSCWMTGASPHWGINFMKRREYDRFWMQPFTSKDG